MNRAAVANPTIGFYLMGDKGAYCLEQFLTARGADAVAWVVYADDAKTSDSGAQRIRGLCDTHRVEAFERRAMPGSLPTADAAFAIAWRWLIAASDPQLVVLHDSLLPDLRGFAPLVTSLIEGRTRIGVTALLATEQFDEGPLLGQKAVEITYPMRIAEAINCVLPLYDGLVQEVYEQLSHQLPLVGLQQNHGEATYSCWRDDRDYRIDWNFDAAVIARFVDAVGAPYAGASSTANGRLLRIDSALEIDDRHVQGRQQHVGKVLMKNGRFPVVICGRGLLKLTEVRFDDDHSDALEKLGFRVRFE